MLARPWFGFWHHLDLGMLGGGRHRRAILVVRHRLGLGEIKITVEDLISAFVGSMLCLGA